MGGLSVSLRDYARFARLYLNGGSFHGEQILTKEWVRDSMDVSAAYSRPGANQDVYNAIGYGYQWWVPEGDRGEFMAIGVYGQWMYADPSRQDHHSKELSASDFASQDYELKHVEFFRPLQADYYKAPCQFAASLRISTWLLGSGQDGRPTFRR